MSNVFDYVNSINDKTEIEFDEKEYVPFIINKAFSNFNDTVIFANLMNQYAFLPKEMQFDFFYCSVSKRKRFSKWPSKKDDEAAKFLSEKAGLNIKKAQELVKVLGPEKIEEIKSEFNYGGETRKHSK